MKNKTYEIKFYRQDLQQIRQYKKFNKVEKAITEATQNLSTQNKKHLAKK